MGADSSMAAITAGSFENVAVSAPIGPSEGVVIQMISQGRSPLMTKTAKKSPHVRNHRRAHAAMVERTSALMMALSMLLMVSKRQSPAMVRMIDRISIAVRQSVGDDSHKRFPDGAGKWLESGPFLV